MESKPLTQRQLLTMKRANIEVKVKKFWEATKNVDLVTEYIVALIVRNALVVSDFSFPCPEVVQELLFHTEPSDVLRKFCPFLKDYVEKSEWEKVISRLFKSKKEYFKETKTMCLYDSYLKNRGTAVLEEHYESYIMVTHFEDVNGKKHTFRMRDVDGRNTLAENQRILRIFTSFTIFEKDGVRRFAKFLDCKCTGTTVIYSSRAAKKKSPEESVKNKETTIEKSPSESTVTGDFFEEVNLESMTKSELIILIKGIFKEVEVAMHEEQLEIMGDTGELWSDDSSSMHHAKMNARNIEETKLDSTGDTQQGTLSTMMRTEEMLRIPVAAGAMNEKSTDKQSKSPTTETSSSKKINKKTRNLIKNFNSSKKKR